jgi:hypothetical protein
MAIAADVMTFLLNNKKKNNVINLVVLFGLGFVLPSQITFRAI